MLQNIKYNVRFCIFRSWSVVHHFQVLQCNPLNLIHHCGVQHHPPSRFTWPSMWGSSYSGDPFLSSNKGKSNTLHNRAYAGAHLPLGPVGGEPLISVTPGQWVQRQTYSYLPSSKPSPPIGWYQIILLGDRGACVITTCVSLYSTAGQLEFEPANHWS